MFINQLFILCLCATPFALAVGKRGLLFDYTVQDKNPNAIDSIKPGYQITRVANWNKLPSGPSSRLILA